MALRFNDLAEATRQRLLEYEVNMSCRHRASQLASVGQLLEFGPWAAQPSVESASGMENLPRWTAEDCELAATSTTRFLCAAPHLMVNGVKLKTRSSLLIVTHVVSVAVSLWFEREEH